MKNKLHKEYEVLIRQIVLETDRVPGFTEIIMKTLLLSIKDRIWVLDTIKQFLEKYPRVKFTGIVVDPRDMSQALRMQLKVRFKCLRCKKIVNESIYPVMPPFIMNGVANKGLVCRHCFYKDTQPHIILNGITS